MTKVCFGFLQEYGGVFSGSYASHIPVLQPIPKTSHFNTDDCSTEGFKKNQAHLSEQTTDSGKALAVCPMKASNFGHISKGHLCGEVVEVTAVLTEVQPTQLWPRY